MLITLRSNTCNLGNTIALVYGNVIDDPSYFALQIVRRFKNAPARRCFELLLRLPMRNIVRGALTGVIEQDNGRVMKVAEAWLRDSSRRSVDGYLLANICLALHEWQTAELILNQLDEAPAAIRARARLQWQLGNLTQAICELARNGASRQLRHYQSELKVLAGVEPIPSSGRNLSNRRAKSVLYFATNSLPHTGSGYAQRTHSILKSLREIGWSSLAVTRINYPANIGKVFARAVDEVDAIPYHRLQAFPAKPDMGGRLRQQTDELLKLVRKHQPSVLHTTTEFTNALSVRAVAEGVGLPWIYEVRGQLADTWASTRPESAQESERYRLFMEREAEVAKAADHVVTLGEQMRANLIKAGVPEEKISILPNGIGEKFLEEPINRDDARAQLGLEREAFYVGTVSSIVPYEGLDTVLRAAALLARHHPELRVLIVGDGTELENLRRLAESLSIGQICHFTGRVPREQAHVYHASLNAFVVPRRDLSVTRAVTPLKPVEALASGVPVLASDLPALRELIVDGENGHLVAPENACAWAEAIERLLNHPDQAESMRTRGRKAVLHTRTWSVNAARLARIYDKVTNSRS
ncbi:glycosyltransferase family 4 protein [Glutamicibacter creatinolyticus]|uniref:glycosyltransferase family 4 protein n=1 Tax=Glutamicibacter creatinolyticus TaxID=162496 RepID=UPI0033D5F6DC